MPFRLDILGPPSIVDPDGSVVQVPVGKPLGVLVYLACAPTPVSRQDLASMFWPDTPRNRSRQSLRQALWLMRQALGQEVFRGDDPVGFLDGVFVTDLSLFRKALAEGDPDEAMRLWRGPLLEAMAIPGAPEWDRWVEDLRADLEPRFVSALRRAAESLRREGRLEEALVLLERALEVGPYVLAVHLLYVRILLDLRRFDAAREALVDARRAPHETEDARSAIRELERELEDALRSRGRGIGGLLAGQLELVGRSRELAQLGAEWRVARTGEVRLAVVTGPAGIGKTRLAREVAALAEAEGGHTTYLKASPAESRLRWGIVADLVRDLLQASGAGGISAASDAVLRTLVPSLARSGAVNSKADLRPTVLRDALADLVEAVAFEAPLAIVLDDLPWADDQSRLLLLAAVRRLKRVPCLILVVARSGLTVRRWVESRRILTEELRAPELLLEPLTREEVAELLGLMAEFSQPDHAERVVRRIHGVTRGNPLFVRELLKKLHEDGVLQEKDGRWILSTEDLPEGFALPESIRTVLRHRLSRLSEDARRVAGTLAREPRRTPVEKLRRSVGLEDAIFTRAISELVEREVCRWGDEGRLEFTHDQLREAVLEAPVPRLSLRSRGPGWTKTRRGRIAAAGVAILLFGLGAAVGHQVEANASAADVETRPRYGGGEIVMSLEGSGQQVRIPAGHGPPEEWAAAKGDEATPPEVRSVFRAADGGEIWFGFREHSIRGPDLVRISPDGRTRVVVGGPGDVSRPDVSPDGRSMAYMEEDVSRPSFARDLYVAGVDGSDPHLLFRGRGSISNPLWSSDGDLIAFQINERVDTVAVISRQGARVASFPIQEVPGLAWCGRKLYALAGGVGPTRLVRLRIPEGTVEVEDTVADGHGLACSPDGSALLWYGVEKGRLRLQLEDLSDDSVHALPVEVRSQRAPRWLPPRLKPVPQTVQAQDHEVRIRWGERRLLKAVVFYSDGSERGKGIRWSSLDPGIASVRKDGLVTGNRAGITRLVAQWGYSFSDTVVVEVGNNGTGGALLREPFERIDTTRWIAIGDPKPRIAMWRGEPVLSIPGDGKYSDGLVGRFPVPLTRGATVELEFHLPIDRNVHQVVHLCLQDADPESANRSVGLFKAMGQEVCFDYPARDLAKFDPRQVLLSVDPGVGSLVDVPGVLPSGGWVHVAIQVRADGEASLYLNHRRVATSPVRVSTEPKAQWCVFLAGSAVGTELLVRNLAVWAEPRY